MLYSAAVLTTLDELTKLLATAVVTTGAPDRQGQGTMGHTVEPAPTRSPSGSKAHPDNLTTDLDQIHRYLMDPRSTELSWRSLTQADTSATVRHREESVIPDMLRNPPRPVHNKQLGHRGPFCSAVGRGSSEWTGWFNLSLGKDCVGIPQSAFCGQSATSLAQGGHGSGGRRVR